MVVDPSCKCLSIESPKGVPHVEINVLTTLSFAIFVLNVCVDIQDVRGVIVVLLKYFIIYFHDTRGRNWIGVVESLLWFGYIVLGVNLRIYIHH